MGQISVVAIRAIMGALSSIYHDRTLYTRKRRKREMADPEDEIRPLIHGKALAYSCCYPLFEMETACLVWQKYDIHGFCWSVLLSIE
jgi:hypothetical protein